MPGVIVIIPLQNLPVKGQLASDLRHEDLILDGADDLLPLIPWRVGGFCGTIEIADRLLYIRTSRRKVRNSFP